MPTPEQTINQAIIETLQNIQDEFGITIRNISTTWVDVSTPDKYIEKLIFIEVDTKTRAK